MGSMLEKIIEWSETLPEWQSDAVRRLLTQDELEPSDKAELLAMLKDQYRLGDSNKPAPKPHPLKKGDVSGGPAIAASIVLKRILAIANVNALPDGSEIPFGHKGLTLIYGENGSGKSGYARILKRACRARDTKERIHPNVFEPIPDGPAKATFKLAVNDRDKEISWIDDETETELLTNICVFDSKCARIIIDNDNKAHYLPFGGHVFGELVSLLKELRTMLQTEKPSPELPDYSDIPQETKSGLFLSQLSVNSKLETVGPWVESDEQRLADIQKRLAQAELEDPAKVAQRLRNFAARAKLLASDLTKIDENASATAEDKIRRTVSSLATAQKALDVAPQASLESEPLPGVGGDVWQLLYRAARDYSIEAAYPNQEFPNTERDSRCVMCMQPLTEEGKSRLLRFRDYMEQRAKKNVDALKKILSDSADKLSALDESLLQKYKDVLDELRSDHAGLVENVEQYCVTMRSRVEGLLVIVKDGKPVAMCPPPNIPTKELLSVVKSIVAEADKIAKTAKPEKLAKLRKDKSELDARKLLWSRKKSIELYIKQLGDAAKYDRCIDATKSRTITTTGKTIITESLTPELCKAIERELSLLNATHLPLNLKPTAAEGQTRHRLEIQTGRAMDKLNLTEILSEGEQRVVGIAGFLAELKAADHTCPIVFDDPVSSLDHRYREKIAERLIQEAAERQVIVFTHNLSFLLDLQSKIGRYGIDNYGEKYGGVGFTVIGVRRENDLVGVVDEELPWHALGVDERLAVLTGELGTFKALYNENRAEYNEHAGNLYNLLRETWEAFIEEVLFHKVVLRHRPSMQTQRLRYVTVNTSDAVAVDQGMTKCSEWLYGHDKAKPLDANRPSPDEIEVDIEALRELKRSFASRRKMAEKDFKKALSPTESPIG